MATTQHTTTDTCDAADCSDTYTIQNATHGYCSLECKQRHIGQRFLNSLKHTHTHCFACGTQLKTTEAPDKEWKANRRNTATDAIVGFEYHTEHAEHGLKGREIDVAFNDLVMTGIVCGVCGTCDHRDDYLREDNLRSFVKNLVEYVNLTRAQGQHEKVLPIHAFIEELKETQGDVELSVGRTLRDV